MEPHAEHTWLAYVPQISKVGFATAFGLSAYAWIEAPSLIELNKQLNKAVVKGPIDMISAVMSYFLIRVIYA
jgi:hypothetical protein